MTNREFLLKRRQFESGGFERVLQAVPDDKLDWRPEAKSRTARSLIGHLIGHDQDFIELLERGEINHRIEVPFTNVADAVGIYRKACEDANAKLAALSDSDWEDGTHRFLVGGNLIMEASRRDLGWLLMCDAIHHRGQLSTYLRPMGGKVPSIYGPSADTMP